MRTAVVAALVAVSVGCTDDGSGDGGEPTSTTPSATSSTAAGTDEPVAEPTAAPQPSETPTSVRCASGDRDAMAATVRAQLAAMADDDWATALGFTTRTFRAGIDEEVFEDLIVDGFPVVADGVTADPLACVTASDGTAGARTASLLVTVEDTSGDQQDLVYLFRVESDEWRIDGAVPADDDAGDDTATI